MVALSTVLSMLKLAEMPYGGSITLASMLPIAVIAYRHGVITGLGSGLVYAALQQLLGLNTLSYVTGWQSVLAVILLDYMLAFTVVGFAGIFRGRIAKNSLMSASERQKLELGTGMVLACILRYILHTVAGATVWAGLSIPTEAALIYSIGYNATYMIPETIVNTVACVWLGGVIDFSKNLPVRFAPSDTDTAQSAEAYGWLSRIAAIILLVIVVADSVMIFPHLQHPDDGSFTFEFLSSVNWIAVTVVSAVGIVIAAVSLFVHKILREKKA